MIWYVDRIEGDTAVLQGRGGEKTAAPLSALPAGVREGSVLSETGGVYTFETELTNARRRRLAALRGRVWNRRRK